MMSTRVMALLSAVILASAVRVEVARAESWPELTEFVPTCPLIVHVRSVPQEVKPIIKRHIKAIASDVAPDQGDQGAVRPHPRRQVPRHLNMEGSAVKGRDMEGSWRVFLPAGFEHVMTMTRVAGDRYQMEPRSLVFSGVYELRGSDLVLIEPSDAAAGDYRWQMHSKHLLTLIEQTHSHGASYVGAAMFRPKQSEP